MKVMSMDDMGFMAKALSSLQKVWVNLKNANFSSFCRFSPKKDKITNFKMRWNGQLQSIFLL
jgi:hypothetical protein